MDFIIRLLGLDAKARGWLVEHIVYIALAVPFLTNLGNALIDLGNICNILSVIPPILEKLAFGSLGLMSAVADVKRQFALIHPLVIHITVCFGSIAVAYMHANHAQRHDEIMNHTTVTQVELAAAVQYSQAQAPQTSPVSAPAPATEAKS